MNDAALVADIRTHRWRQGSVLPPAVVAAAGTALPGVQPEDWCIVVSQSCDVVHPHHKQPFVNEPYVEVLVARPFPKPTAKLDANFRANKNARQIQFEIPASKDQPALKLAASIHDRHRIDRKLLAQAGPATDRVLPDKLRNMLTQWVGKRYLRAAYPDGVNIAAKPSEEAINAFLAKHTTIIHSVWFACYQTAPPPRATYGIEFVVAIDKDYTGRWAELHPQLHQEATAAWSASHGIEVACAWHDELTSSQADIECEIVQAERLGVQEISDRKLTRYDKDWITYEQGPEAEPTQVEVSS